MGKLIFSSAKTLARAIRVGEVSSEEVVDAYLKRIKEVNPKINAVVQLTEDSARAEAKKADEALKRGEVKGPLHGVPVTIKDEISVVGVICADGTKGLASFVPREDAPIVARMRSAGAVVLGKTNVPEMSLAAETDNLVYGRTNNPYDLKRTPGGSSGGEAAIIAAGGSPMGLGSDMGGSIRIPAHFCGIAGLKPTSGRVPQSPFPPDGLWDVLWQFGPMARRVEDLVLILPIIAGIDWRDPTMVPMPLGNPGEVKLGSLRAAFYTDNGIVSSTRETVRVIEKTVESLSDAGLKVEENRPEGVEQSYDIIIGLFGADGGAGIRRQLQNIGTTEISPLLKRFLDLGRAYKATTVSGFLDLMRKRAMFKSSVFSFMEKYDVIICPVCAWPAQPHGFSFDDEGIKAAVSYTCTYNLTGMPGAVVRGGTSPEGLPIGVQIVSRPWREDVALAVARHIEKTLGGWQPPPI